MTTQRTTRDRTAKDEAPHQTPGDSTAGDKITGAAPSRPSPVVMPGATPAARTTFAVAGEFDVFHARTLAAQIATRIGFSRPAVYRLATTVSELGNNLVAHTPAGGRISLTPVSRDGVQGIEVVVEDDGPGIGDTEMAMTDGFSSNRGLGSGLPGCRRLMDEFALESSIGHGTRVTACLWLRGSARAAHPKPRGGVTAPVVIARSAPTGGRSAPDENPGPRRPPACHDGDGLAGRGSDRAGGFRRVAASQCSSR
jgi:serine/threonine-protein kinase RsbT